MNESTNQPINQSIDTLSDNQSIYLLRINQSVYRHAVSQVIKNQSVVLRYTHQSINTLSHIQGFQSVCSAILK